MKKIMFSVVSVVAALLISVVMISCSGGGGGGGGSGALGGDQGEPSGTSTYGSTQAFPNGFFKTAVNGGYSTGALWINEYNSNNALYFIDATHARDVTRVSTTNTWGYNPGNGSYEVEITSGANGYVRFSASEAYPASFAYNISDDVLVISNTRRGTRRYTRAPSGWIVN
ncbi:MAG: hypothetical protein IKZ86_01255 [Spirochaetaceae bacterium]|nr:hypothetical protein [Spirochaetaceae bacterium]